MSGKTVTSKVEGIYKFITNNYDPGKKRPKICCEKRVIFEPYEGGEYSHHPRIIEFKGKIYVMFSVGHINEDDVGQHVQYCITEDFNEWTAPQVLVAPWPGEKRPMVLSPGGWYTDGETLVAYFAILEYTEDWIVDGHRKPGSKGRVHHGIKCITSKDGLHWGKPIDIGQGFGCNHQPTRLKSGRLLFSGAENHAYTDNNDGVHDWKYVRCFPQGYPGRGEADNGEGVDTMSGLVGQTVGLCEGSFVQIDSGTIYMFLRSGTDYLWASESRDDGETWSLPKPTLFTDNRTKFHLGRLPGGKYYYVGTPDPFPPRTRHVLALSLSDDGLNYTQHFILADEQYKGKYVGLDKNGVYGYPSTMVLNGYFYVTVSICKETIIVLRFPCDTL
jgi:hypothetical protein